MINYNDIILQNRLISETNICNKSEKIKHIFLKDLIFLNFFIM